MARKVWRVKKFAGPSTNFRTLARAYTSRPLHLFYRDGQCRVRELNPARNLRSNDGVNLDATVLYADMADSTALVDKYTKTFAAEIYKTYLHCAAKIITSEGGTITAYD